MNNLTLGSLFDGSGGFPLGAFLNGIIPVWASEIEPFPIRVTTKRFPDMQHLGDVSKINGGEIPPVDIITFGSPCTDMSVAGKRAGLNGKQSSLFHEAIRIIKEMRCKTNGRYPRYIVWENVPGAYSSSKGEDFRCVLEEIVKVKQEGPVPNEAYSVPMPEKSKWLYAGELLADDFSVAWRTLDAQFWGVPQRRRRIYLVADFGGFTASKVLFESEGLLGNSASCGKQWQGAAADAEGSSAPSGKHTCAVGFEPGAMSRLGGYFDIERTGTLRASMGDNQTCVAVENHPNDSRVKLSADGKSQALTSRAGTGGGNVPLVMKERQFALTVGKDVANTLTSTDYKGTQCVFENHSQDTRYVGPLEKAQTVSATYGEGGNNQPFVVSGDTLKTMKLRCGCKGGGKGPLIQNDKSATLSCNNEQSVFVPKAYGICSDGSNSMKSDNPHSGVYEADTSRTIDANGGNPGCNQGGLAVVEAKGFDGYNGDETGDVSATLGANCGMSTGRQGVISVQGSIIGRKDENGPNGSGVNEDVSFTLDATDRHAVAYVMTTGSFAQVSEEQSPTLLSRDYKDAPVVSHPAYGIDRAAFNQGQNAQYKPEIKEEQQPTLTANGPGAVAQPASFYPQMKAESQCFREDGKANTIVNGTNPGYQNGLVEPEYAVRRLTPLECCRLQGFPDFWCTSLETENPTAEDIKFWTEVFETHRLIMGTSSKPKSEKAIIKWLQNPYSDSAEYKMWGNGVCYNNVFYVMAGIVRWYNTSQ